MPQHSGPTHSPHSEPLRRIVRAEYRYDDVAGRFVLVPTAEELTSIAGSEVSTIHTCEAFVCGCSREQAAGGTCYHCGRPSCARCFAHCLNCLKPICPAHTKQVADGQGRILKLCVRCAGNYTRARMARALCRSVLSLFVTHSPGGTQ